MPKGKKEYREADLKVTSFSKKGNGLAWMERKDLSPIQVEVPFSAPDDIIRTQLLGKRGTSYRGKLQQVLTPSAHRVAPRCAHFGTCGGCRLQHISPEQQLQHKEILVRNCFATLPYNIEVLPIIPAAKSWHYRSKMEYSFFTDNSGQKALGLIIEGSKGRVFDINECHLVDQWFIKVVKAVKTWWEKSGANAYNMFKNTGTLRTLTLREGQRTGDKMVVLTISGNPDYSLPDHQVKSFLACVREALEPLLEGSHLSVFLRIQQANTGMTTNTYDMLLYGPGQIREVIKLQHGENKIESALTFNVGPSDFFQPNPQQADQFYSVSLKMAEMPESAVFYSLYSGVGTLAICASKYAKTVIGIELSPETVLNARNNAQLNKCSNVKIIAGAVRYVLQEIAELNLPAPDVVAVIPPRAGLDPEAIRHLQVLNPPKILYASANPLTQVGNIDTLMKYGYTLDKVQPIDLFPQTYHVGSIAVLKRK